MKLKRQTKDGKKPERKLEDLIPKKDARGGEIVFTKTTDSSSATIQK
jgi:hypothetical protein